MDAREKALVEAAKDAERVPMLFEARAHEYATYNGGGRTTAAETKTIARRNITQISTEIREIQERLREALAAYEEEAAEVTP